MNQSQESETHFKILQAAKEEFSRLGFNGARVDQIAKKANVNKALIYYYYKSKDDLYEAVIDSIFSKDEKYNILKSENKSSFEKLISIIEIFFQKMEKDQLERCSIIAREMVSRSEIFFKMRDKYWIKDFKLIIDILEEGKEKGEFKFSLPVEYISFTIYSHIVFYKINEVTYKSSEFYDKLYPEDNRVKMIGYIKNLLNKLIFESEQNHK